jgi:pyroglutamyl-peptidase
MTTVLVTGFGPFPGAPFNPTGPLVERLARMRRPALADVRVVTHVFHTRLIAMHKPDALLMFGLAPRAKTLRIETRARNSLALLADASGQSLRRTLIAKGGPSAMALPAGARQLFAAGRSARIPLVISRDAGRYLCNYLCWRAAEAAGQDGPRIASFIHVPPVRRFARRPGKRQPVTIDDLSSAGGRFLVAVAVAVRRQKTGRHGDAVPYAKRAATFRPESVYS